MSSEPSKPNGSSPPANDEIELPPRAPAKPTLVQVFAPQTIPQKPPRNLAPSGEDEEVEAIIQGIHRAAQEGNVLELETFLKNGVNPNVTDKNGRSPLHNAVSIECRCTNCLTNALDCVKLLINTQLVEVNAQDDLGNTPLHLAIENQLTGCAQQLISAGADVCIKSNSGQEAVYLLTKKLPDTMTYLLDECIFVDQFDPIDERCVLKVDFSPLVGNPKFKMVDGRTSSIVSASSGINLRISWQQEMKLLLSILQNPVTRPWRTKILTHPVVQIFMEQEWKRARKYFWCSVISYIVYVLLLTGYILYVYFFICPSSIFTPVNATESELFKDNQSDNYLLMHNFNGNRFFTDARPGEPSSNQCEMATGGSSTLVIIILALTIFLGFLEIGKMIITPRMYLQSRQSLGTWIFVALVLYSTVPNLERRKSIEKYQYQAASFTVFLAWAFILQQIGKFPSLGKYIEMFGVVLRSFGFFVITFISLFIGFAISFYILFPTRSAFKHFLSSLLKTFIMMTGEVDYNTMFYGTGEAVKGSYMAHILFAAFVFVVSIVLMNLVIGLTVSDIQQLQENGELRRMSRLILELHRLESFIFSKRIPRSIGDKLKASISVLQPNKEGRREGLIFEFRPNSNDDTSVPKHLKQQALRLASISYEKFRATECSKLSGVSSEGNGQVSNHPVLLRRLNRQHYKLIAVKSSIYKRRRRHRQPNVEM